MSARSQLVIDADALTSSDFGTGDDGQVITVSGHPVKDLQLKHFMAIAVKLRIKGLRGMKKDDMVKEISKSVYNWKAYGKYDVDVMAFRKEKTRKEIHCSFRLLNIVFSDKFANDLASLGLSPSRAVLDTGKAGCDRHFWEQVESDFKSDDVPYGELMFVDEDPVFEQQKGLIVPSKIILHDWKKLRQIWKGVVTDYKAANLRFTQSGTHDASFYNFCQGKLEPYYLRKFLDLKPDILGYVAADLPEGTFLDSSAPLDTSSDNQSGEELEIVEGREGEDGVIVDAVEPVDCGVTPPSARCARKSKKGSEVQGIGESIRFLGDERKISNEKRIEVSEKRNELMEKDNSNKLEINKKRNELMEKDLVLRETYINSKTEKQKVDQAIKLRQDKRKEKKAIHAEWEYVSTNISRLRSEIRQDGIDDETKLDLENDLKLFQNKKRKLADQMELTE